MMNWFDARPYWVQALLTWAVTLTGGLLGALTDHLLLPPPHQPFTANLPWLVGGSLFVALVASRSRYAMRRAAARGED